MANIGKLIKDEIQRLSRKQARVELNTTRKAATQHRSDIASLKRQLSDLQRRLAFLEKRERSRLGQEAPAENVEGARFSARGLKTHRTKLGLSAADYGKLAGVTQLTIYNWESGKNKPRPAQLAKLVAVRKLGKREAARRLQVME